MNRHASCALTQRGEVRCWGRNVSGILGPNQRAGLIAATPVALPSVTGATSLSLGGEATLPTACVVMNQELWCWGSGQLVNGNPAALKSLTKLPTSVPIVSVALGAQQGCALDDQGQVWCWGWGKDRAFNPTLVDPELSFHEPSLRVGLRDVTQVVLGAHHACALQRPGTVSCWGLNNMSGRLGHTEPGFSATPKAVTGLEGVASLALAEGMSCARHQDGRVSCWGLGFGPKPHPVPGLEKARTLRANGDGDQACALSGQSEGYCWGQQGHGQPIAQAHNSLLLQPARHHLCRADAHTVACWGRNRDGVLGDGTLIDRDKAVEVAGILDRQLKPPSPPTLPRGPAQQRPTLLPGTCRPETPITVEGFGERSFELRAAWVVDRDKAGQLWLGDFGFDPAEGLPSPRGSQRLISLRLSGKGSGPIRRGKHYGGKGAISRFRLELVTGTTRDRPQPAINGWVWIKGVDAKTVCGELRLSDPRLRVKGHFVALRHRPESASP